MSTNHNDNPSIYSSYEPYDQMVFVKMNGGKIDLSIYLSNETDNNPEINYAIETWADTDEPVIIAPHFTIAAPLDYLICFHELRMNNNVIDASAKPMFDALRAEMAEQIARIDALTFIFIDPEPR